MKLRQFAIALMLAVLGLTLSSQTVLAQQAQQAPAVPVNACTFIRPICDAIGLTEPGGSGEILEGGDGARQFLSGRLQLILSLVFVGIILLSVVIIVQSGVKYIQSQGDAGKIEEATKAIKTVFVGIAILFVGIAGLILVLFVFNATGLLTPTSPTPDAGEACRIDPITLVLVCPTDTNTGP